MFQEKFTHEVTEAYLLNLRVYIIAITTLEYTDWNKTEKKNNCKVSETFDEQYLPSYSRYNVISFLFKSTLKKKRKRFSK